MKNLENKAAVFVLLGQSNAVGHGIPMKDEDKITEPLKNVFGLGRKLNQSFDNDTLNWTGYMSAGMNLAEEQDDTYSVANYLAKLWQDEIDAGAELPDLFIIQIAIGAQGITEGYMWNPEYKKTLIPGKLGTVNISLYPYTLHILSLVEESLTKVGKTDMDIKIHWRGGENDTTASEELLKSTLKDTYNTIFGGVYQSLGERADTVIHRLVCRDRCMDLDPTGAKAERMDYVNTVFEDLALENANISLFDVRNAPHYIPNMRGNGIFIEDVVHYTPETNKWVAEEILKNYK